MQNDADHNVTRMNLGQAARQQSSTKRPAVQVAATRGVDLKPLATFIAPIRISVQDTLIIDETTFNPTYSYNI